MIMSNSIGITLSSRAMFSTWCYHKPSRTLFDAGEGVSLHMLTEIFGIERVMLSHGHADHINGLFSLIGLRAKAKGDRGKPLAVYYPGDNRQFGLIREYIGESWSALPYDLSWHPIKAGDCIKAGKTHSIVSFPMAHQQNTSTLGYRLVETRTGLLPFVRSQIKDGLIEGVKVGDYLAAARAKGDVVDESRSHTSFVYATDHYDLDDGAIKEADLVIMDCTFLDTADRTPEHQVHASLEESARRCAKWGVHHMVAAHVSIRNDTKAVVARAAELSAELGMPITVCRPEEVLYL